MRLKAQVSGRVAGSRRGIPRIDVWAYKVSNGTDGITGVPVATNEADARRAWPFYRRQVWAHTHVGELPFAATVWDGLTTSGHALLWDTWQRERFPIAAVLRDLEADREAVRGFEGRDPQGAASIADFLALFCGHLDRVESEARRIAARPDATRWTLGAPETGDVRRYGERIAADGQ